MRFISFGTMDVTKPYDIYKLWCHRCHQTLEIEKLWGHVCHQTL